MKSMIVMIACLLFTIAQTHGATDSINVSAALKHVTVYRSGAEMSHTTSATLKQGTSEMVIENFSNNIDVNSIQIKAPEAVTILRVEFSNNYLPSTEKSARETMLEDSLEHTKKETDKLTLVINNNNGLLNVLEANKDIKGEQTGLTVTELAKLMDYYKTKTLELQTDNYALNEKKNKLIEQSNKLQQQIQEEQQKNVQSKGRLLLQVSTAVAGKYDFAISYIAKNAYWMPYYDVRVNNTKDPVKFVCKAHITQTTGIDWKQVKLSLSTSVPSQWGNAPELSSWFVGYIDPVAEMNKTLYRRELTGAVASVETGTLNDVVVTGFNSIKIRGMSSMEGDNEYKKPEKVYIVNGAMMSESEFQKISPNAIKKMEVLKPNTAENLYGSRAAGGAVVVELKSELQDYVSVTNNTLDMTFDIDMLYDIPTNGKEQSATLQTLNIPAEFKDYAVPKLDKDAYLLAYMKDWEKLNLMPGEANIILEGTYVGKSFIDPNATSDTLSLTLGRDKRVVVKKEKLADFSSVKFFGTNKLQKLAYEYTIKNNKNEAVNMQLKDQYPISTNKEIEVGVIETSNAEVNKDNGLLTWKISLKPGETKTIRLEYSVKYPKDKLVNL